MAKTSEDSPFGSGGSLAYPTRKEVPIAATATLTTAAHAGKTLEVCMTVDDQVLTLYSAASLTRGEKDVGFSVSTNSKPFMVVDASGGLVALLLPGANGHVYANAATTAGDWQFFGSGNLRFPWARNVPTLFDTGATTNADAMSSGPRNRLAWVSTTCFVFVFARSNNIYAHVVTVDATTKVCTVGALQTIRDVAATMGHPLICTLSNGNVAIVWQDVTNTKLEGIVCSVDSGARTLTAGTAVDFSATTTYDATSYPRGICADAGTAGAFWVQGDNGAGILTYCTTSGTTLTVDADNSTTLLNGLIGTELYSPSTNKCITANSDGLRQFQFTAGAVTSEWLSSDPEAGGGANGVVVLENSKVYAEIGNRGYVATIGASGVTNWKEISIYGPLDQAAGTALVSVMIGVDDHTLLAMHMIYRISMFNLETDGYFNYGGVVIPDNYQQSRSFNKLVLSDGGALTTLPAMGINRTTHEVAIVHEGIKATSGNVFFAVNVFEIARN